MAFLDFLRGLWAKLTGAESAIPESDRPSGGIDASPDGSTGRRSAPPATDDRPVRKTTASPTKAEPAAMATIGDDDHRDDLDMALGAAFDTVMGGSGTQSGTRGTSHDDGAARELFATIAANFSRPVKNFIFELQRGSATKDWIEICQPVMGSIIDGAESLELHAAVQRMVDFREALSLAGTSSGRVLDEDSRALILSCYDELVEELPETFVLDDTDRRRESILIHSLLRQIPEVGSVTLEKLYGAGLTSLDALFLATADDLTVASGVPEWLCARICTKVQEHRDHLEGASPESAQVDQRGRLVELVRELGRQQEIFQRISDEDRSDPELAAQKRDCLRNRQACALQINVVLAEMGEVDLVEQLRKLAVERRIDELEQYLDGSTEALSAIDPVMATQNSNSAPNAR